MPFLASYYNGREAVHPVSDPMGAVTTVDRHALVVPDEELRVEDCGFRMIVPKEIKAAMAFPNDYILLGGQREQVRLLGNAVTPPVMTMIFQRCVETLQ
jgi:DNA (cytosine-5)-methyltransferase 1